MGRAVNGWGFWLVDPKSKRSLHDLRTEYADGTDVEVDDVPDDPADDED